ncbi:MAG: PEGA domain-containing protein [Thermoguttaceae bacterium]
MSDRTLTSFARRAIWAGVLLAVVLLTTQSGCVERRMTIRTNPPGALVYVDDYEIGATPVSTDFTYYGTRKIRIVKDGYETLTVMQPFPAPWYQYPPADFITENFVPGKIRDQRILDYQLKPQMIVPTDQLLYRAESLRHNNLVVPAGATMSRPDGLVPNQQPMAPNALPGTLPGTPPNSNQYSPPNTSVPPGASIQPNTYPQPNVNQPTSGIGGQQVYPLPPR